MSRFAAFFLFAFAASCSSSSPPTRSLPPIADNLPSEVKKAEKVFDDRVRTAFPIGTSEKDAVLKLQKAGFDVGPPQLGGLRFADMTRESGICQSIWSVRWKAKAQTLSEVFGVYGLRCP